MIQSSIWSGHPLLLYFVNRHMLMLMQSMADACAIFLVERDRIEGNSELKNVSHEHQLANHKLDYYLNWSASAS